MRFFRTASLDPELASLLWVDPQEPLIDPDTIWRAAKYNTGWDEATTFILIHLKTGQWQVQKTFGTANHGNLSAYNEVFYDKDMSQTLFDKIIMGRLITYKDNVVVAFWKRDYLGGGVEDSELLSTAIPVLKQDGLIPPGYKLWVAGTQATLIAQPNAGWSKPKTQVPRYTIEGRQYSYMDLASAAHSLPQGSSEYQAIAEFIANSNAPELKGLAHRFHRVKSPKPIRSPRMFEVMKPENLESLGSQSRIDRYWDAVTSSRRFRLARGLVKKVLGI